MKNMKIGLCAIVAIIFGAFVVNANPVTNKQQGLLGAKECTWGPSYWCSNFENAKGCNAVRHCIQTVWEKQKVPVDDDSICKICKDMVTQARDQLRSNETMEELKEVFEGSCNLIPIKVVKKECCNLADNFIPELVEALSSEMNPDQVCSVAGLCNSEKIDNLLATYFSAALDGTLKEEDVVSNEEVKAEKVKSANSQAAPGVKKPRQLSCGNCQQLGTLINNRFTAANRDDILENILHLCGQMSSFSDACANIVLTYFSDIYDNFKNSLTPQGLCHLSGVCSSKYHQHAEDLVGEDEGDITALSGVGNDDIPCELCEQLVKHLRDVLVANTTETEFKQVLEGLCKQSKGFKDECLSIVDQYYDVIYQALVSNLDANGACFMIGVCPKGKNSAFEGEIMPLLPVLPPAEIKVTIRKKLGQNEPKYTQEELSSMALPIDKLMGAANPGLLVENGELCTLCEYLLHFIQETLATPATEDDIKRTVNNICNALPSSLHGKCHDFVDMYGDAVIALLIQGLDPREICPKLQMCPSNNPNRKDVEVIAPKLIDHSDKPTCPLCLFAVEQAQQEIRNDKSKKNIKNVLGHLCSRLPSKLKAECDDFVETYTNELIDMLITDFKPQEICVALKLCENENTFLSNLGISLEDDDDVDDDDDDGDFDIERHSFNEIDSDDELPIEIAFEQHNAGPAPNCFLCEEVIKVAEKKLGKHKTKEEIIQALDNSCDKLRLNIRKECHKYVSKYGDKVAILILKEMEPKIICRELGLCLWSEQEDLEIDEALKYDVIAMPNTKISLVQSGLDDVLVVEPPSCVLCEFVMTKLDTDLRNASVQDEIIHAVENICSKMPNTIRHSCDKFIEKYANTIISLLSTLPPKQICQNLGLCAAALDVISDEVIECGVCHGAAMTLLPYLRQHLQPETITSQKMTTVACENLPAKYYEICVEMISIYGPSMQSLSEKKYMDDAHVCAEIGKCFDNEKSSLAFARITSN